MPQIELADQDLEKVDRLVRDGVFKSRESALKGILESLSEDELKRVEEAKLNVDLYLMTYVGDMLYSTVPVKVIIIDGKDMYKIPVKSASDKTKEVFYAYVDTRTLEVDVNMSMGLRSLPEMSQKELEERKKFHKIADNYCKTHLDNEFIAGAPFTDALETEEGFRDCFKVPLIGEYEGKAHLYGYLFIDAETLAMEPALFKKERVHEIDSR